MKLTGGGANGKYTADELSVISLDEVKKMILIQDPKAFDKKKTAKKATAPKKASPKKAVAKKAATKKAVKKK